MLGLGFSIGVQIIIGRRNEKVAYTTIPSVFYHGVFPAGLFRFVVK